MKFNIYKQEPHEFLAPKYISRDEDGSYIAIGYTKKGTIKATKREIMKSEELIGTYEMRKVN